MKINNDKVKLLLTSLAAGDCLGVSSEFVHSGGAVLQLYNAFKNQGWPFEPVGRGSFGLEVGAHSDDTDMAWGIVKSIYNQKKFDTEDIANEFVNWLHTKPKDIGRTTADVLCKIDRGYSWIDASFANYSKNPNGAANGSLMRNGVIPAFTENTEELFEYSTLHGLITHFGPLPVLCCCLQSWIIDYLLSAKNDKKLKDIFVVDWKHIFVEDWVEWINKVKNSVIADWKNEIGKGLIEEALKTIMLTKFTQEEGFNPFEADYNNRAGYCLLTLQVAIWALRESMKDKSDFVPPESYPQEIFEKKGAYVLGWIPMIGWDADTYAATAGPLIAAYHGKLPECMTEKLQINGWFEELLEKTK